MDESNAMLEVPPVKRKRNYRKRTPSEIRAILKDYKEAKRGQKSLTLAIHGVRTSHVTYWQSRGYDE
jgi:hypothetical protein